MLTGFAQHRGRAADGLDDHLKRGVRGMPSRIPASTIASTR